MEGGERRRISTGLFAGLAPARIGGARMAVLDLGNHAVEDGEAEGDFLEERDVVRDENEAMVLGPEGAQAGVECDGFLVAFGADGIAVIDAEAAGGRGFEEDDGVVTGEFLFEGGADGGEEVMGFAGPVGGAVHRAAVAEENAFGIEGGLNVFEVALHVEDGALGGVDGGGFLGAGEAAGEKQGGGLGNNDDPLADFAAEKVGGGGLAAAGSAGENNATTVVGGGFHGGLELKVL